MILDPSWFGYLMHFDAICLSASATLLHTSPSSQFLSVGSIRSRPAGWLDVAGCGWMWLDVAGQHVATHQGIAVSAFLKYSNFSFPFSSDFASSQGNFSEISGIPKLKKTPKHPKLPGIYLE